MWRIKMFVFVCRGHEKSSDDPHDVFVATGARFPNINDDATICVYYYLFIGPFVAPCRNGRPYSKSFLCIDVFVVCIPLPCPKNPFILVRGPEPTLDASVDR